MTGLLGNPMFAAGMGLLQGSTPSRTPHNAAGNLMQGLLMSEKQKEAAQLKQLRTLQMAQMQKELQAQPERRIIKGADGRQYYEDGSPVLPNVQPAPATTDDLTEYKAAVEQGYGGTFQQYMLEMKKAGASTTSVTLPQNLPYKLQEGYMLKDPADPAQGVTPIPGGSRDAMSTENAGKTQMLRTAKEAYKGVKGMVYDNSGEVNRTILATAAARIPMSEGRELATRMETGIQAITRSETGAAMPPQEVENTRKRFMPSPLDNDATIKIKLQMYEDFLNGSLKLIDPSGRFDGDRFQAEFDARQSGVVTDSAVQSMKEKYHLD